MSHRALGEQFVSHTELAGMYSGDFDEPMPRTLHNLRVDYQNYKQGYSADDAVHPMDEKHGGPDNYISHLKKDISKNGIREPLEIRGGNVVTEGHHRAVAAMQLRLPRIPVRHIQ